MIFENEDIQRTDRRARFTQQPMGMGKIPPQAVDLEEAVLGALLLESDAKFNLPEFITDQVFYRDAHQKIFQTIMDLIDSCEPVDLLTVTAKLRMRGDLEMIGGSYALTEITNRVASSANIEYHAMIVYQKFLQRELIRLNTDSINAAYEDTTDVISLMEKIETDLYKLSIGNHKRQGTGIKDLSRQSKVEMKRVVKDGITGVPSGYHELDRNTGGWQKSDLYIIAARPAMGKTAFVLNVAKNAAIDFDAPVVVFSLEMSSIQLTQRLQSGESGVPFEHIRRCTLTADDIINIDTKLERLESAPIIIDDTPGLSLFEFRSKCRRLKAKHDIQLIIIDYLQLMNGRQDNKNGNREQEIGNISRTLKLVAKELNVPVIALSQLSRTVESRAGGNKRPQLSDLRESGSIEQDADAVFFLYRPEYYGITYDENNQSTAGKMEVIGAKHRNGKVETIPLRLNGSYMQVSNWNNVVHPQNTDIQPSMNFQVKKNEDEKIPF